MCVPVSVARHDCGCLAVQRIEALVAENEKLQGDVERDSVSASCILLAVMQLSFRRENGLRVILDSNVVLLVCVEAACISG